MVAVVHRFDCSFKLPEQESCGLVPELLSGAAVNDEVDGRVEHEEQVVQVLQHVNGDGDVMSGNEITKKSK